MERGRLDGRDAWLHGDGMVYIADPINCTRLARWYGDDVCEVGV
jgi:hypothetical protein